MPALMIFREQETILNTIIDLFVYSLELFENTFLLKSRAWV